MRHCVTPTQRLRNMRNAAPKRRGDFAFLSLIFSSIGVRTKIPCSF